MKSLFTLLLYVSLSFATPLDLLNDTLNTGDSKTYSPALTMPLSIVPGGGQFMAREPLRGALFLGFETLFGVIAVDRWQRYHNREEAIGIAQYELNIENEKLLEARNKYWPILSNSLEADDSAAQSELDKAEISVVEADLHVSLLRNERFEQKMLHRNYSTWFAGMFAWNMLDAASYGGAFQGASTPKPKRAMALSAIPFTGAGQFYNGKAYKAGLVITMQVGCLVSALNFQRVIWDMRNHEKRLAENPYYLSAAGSLNDELWQDRYDSAIRSRTLFMWYGIIFYIYGLLDAYTDAHLHGFEEKFHFSGGYNPITESITTNLTFDFGRRRK